MKSKLLLLSFLMLFIIATNYAQSSASISGIAVQGIARDNNNTALADETITFKFTLYYNDPGPINVFVENTPLTTDAFGVFSYILDVDPSTNANFSNNSIFLKIEDVTSGTIISDEVFKHVPYAISANNGVPTGSIIPYIGTDAPEGWVLCDGRSLTTIDGSDELQLLVGANTPNLQGMFLRGAGGSGDHIGPDLKQAQDDAIKTHNPTITDPGHAHSINDPGHQHNLLRTSSSGWGDAAYYGDSDGGGAYTTSTRTITGATTDITINPSATSITAEYTGATETRPINYGVNYIIKL